MGWIYLPNTSRKDLIEELTDPRETMAHTLVREDTAEVLWAVLRTSENASPIIVGSLLKCSGDGWGHRDMAERTHPHYYSCPLQYLELAPPTCPDWREAVRRYHATHPASHSH